MQYWRTLVDTRKSNLNDLQSHDNNNKPINPCEAASPILDPLAERRDAPAARASLSFDECRYLRQKLTDFNVNKRLKNIDRLSIKMIDAGTAVIKHQEKLGKNFSLGGMIPKPTREGLSLFMIRMELSWMTSWHRTIEQLRWNWTNLSTMSKYPYGKLNIKLK